MTVVPYDMMDWTISIYSVIHISCSRPVQEVMSQLADITLTSQRIRKDDHEDTEGHSSDTVLRSQLCTVLERAPVSPQDLRRDPPNTSPEKPLVGKKLIEQERGV